MQFSDQLVSNFFAVAAEPTRTDLIFEAITAPDILKDDVLAKFVERIKTIPGGATLIAERYERPWRVAELAEYPQDSFAYAYARHMIDNGLDADFFAKVPGDTEGAYVQMRARQTHDIWHVLTGFTTSVADEAGLQSFQQAQMSTRSSATIMAMFLMHGALYDVAVMDDTTSAIARGWLMGKGAKQLFGERFEENWSRNLNEYRQALGLIPYIQEKANEVRRDLSI